MFRTKKRKNHQTEASNCHPLREQSDAGVGVEPLGGIDSTKRQIREKPQKGAIQVHGGYTEKTPGIGNSRRARNSHLGSPLSFDKDIHRYCPNLQTRCSSDLKLSAPSYDLGQWARN